MNKEQVLAIPSLTPRQRETAEIIFNSPYYRKNGEINGTQAQVKQFLDKAYERRQLTIARKAKKIEKYGSFAQVESLVKSLVKDRVYSYKAIVDIINKATEERRQAIERIKEMEAQIKAEKEALGI